MFSKTLGPLGHLRREHTRNPATWISIRTQGTKRCSCDKTAALAHHKHTWISLRAQRDMFRRKDYCVLTRRGHLDLFPCANRHVHATTLLRSHAASTLGSHSVRKKTCSGDNTVARARCEHTWISLRAQRGMFRRNSRRKHTWISLRAQRDMFHRKDCCVLTPRAHLDLAPCAKRHVGSKRLLRSHATSTLGSLSVRRETCSGKATADFSRRENTWISLRAQRDGT